MSTQTATPRDAPAPQTSGITKRLPGARSRRVGKPKVLLALTSGLLALLILNLAVFDDLRTDETADLAGTFLAPQHLTSILACLLAVVMLGTRKPVGASRRADGRLDRDRPRSRSSTASRWR